MFKNFFAKYLTVSAEPSKVKSYNSSIKLVDVEIINKRLFRGNLVHKATVEVICIGDTYTPLIHTADWDVYPSLAILSNKNLKEKILSAVTAQQ